LHSTIYLERVVGPWGKKRKIKVQEKDGTTEKYEKNEDKCKLWNKNKESMSKKEMHE
jgi:hypothetical protein